MANQYSNIIFCKYEFDASVKSYQHISYPNISIGTK